MLNNQFLFISKPAKMRALLLKYPVTFQTK